MKKKIVLSVMFILIFTVTLNLLCKTTASANTHASENIIFFNDFDDGTLQGWNTRDNSHVSSEQSHSGSYSLKLQDDVQGEGQAECYKVFNPVVEGTTEFWMYIPSNNVAEVDIYLSNQATWSQYPNEMFRIQVRLDGSVRYYDGDYHYFTVRTPLSFNTWNKITLSWNSETAQLHLNINDVFYGRAPQYQYGDAIRQIVFEGDCKKCTGTYAWFDDIQVITNKKLIVASWHMNERSGSKVTDFSGNNNNGTIYHAEWVSGISGTALEFNKIEQGYIVIPDNPLLDITDDFTITAWIKPYSHSGTSDNQLTILSKHISDTNSDGSWSLVLQNDTLCFMNYDNATNVHTITSISEIPIDTWSFIGISFGNETKMIVIYINGLIDTFETHDLSIKDTNADLYIGSENGQKKWFDGIIDEICVYNYVLFVSELQQQYTNYTSIENNKNDGNTAGFEIIFVIGACTIIFIINRRRCNNN